MTLPRKFLDLDALIAITTYSEEELRGAMEVARKTKGRLGLNFCEPVPGKPRVHPQDLLEWLEAAATDLPPRLVDKAARQVRANFL